MNLVFLAASGHDKSYGAQAVTERNIDTYDHVVVLDREDEFRGLCSKECEPAPCKHWLAGQQDSTASDQKCGLISSSRTAMSSSHG